MKYFLTSQSPTSVTTDMPAFVTYPVNDAGFIVMDLNTTDTAKYFQIPLTVSTTSISQFRNVVDTSFTEIIKEPTQDTDLLEIVTDLESENELLKSTNAADLERISSLESEVQDLRDQLSELLNDYTSALQENNDIQATLQAALNSSNELKQKVDELSPGSTDNASDADRIRLLEAEVTSLRTKLNSLVNNAELPAAARRILARILGV